MGSIHKMSLVTAFPPSFTASYEVLNGLKRVRKLAVFMKQISFSAPLVDIQR